MQVSFQNGLTECCVIVATGHFRICTKIFEANVMELFVTTKDIFGFE